MNVLHMFFLMAWLGVCQKNLFMKFIFIKIYIYIQATIMRLNIIYIHILGILYPYLGYISLNTDSIYYIYHCKPSNIPLCTEFFDLAVNYRLKQHNFVFGISLAIWSACHLHNRLQMAQSLHNRREQGPSFQHWLSLAIVSHRFDMEDPNWFRVRCYLKGLCVHAKWSYNGVED